MGLVHSQVGGLGAEVNYDPLLALYPSGESSGKIRQIPAMIDEEMVRFSKPIEFVIANNSSKVQHC